MSEKLKELLKDTESYKVTYNEITEEVLKVDNLHKLQLEHYDTQISNHIENKDVHNKILNMIDKMIDEEPSLKYTVLGGIKLNHKEKVKEEDITIQYLQQEKKEFLNKL